MKRWRAGLLIVALLAALGGIVMAVASLLDGLCANTLVERILAPDGRREAVLFARNCGATTGYSTHVSVFAAGDSLPNEAGNVFAADLADGGTPAPWGGPMVELRWTEANALVVRHDPLARIPTAEEETDGIQITYQQAEQGSAPSPRMAGR